MRLMQALWAFAALIPVARAVTVAADSTCLTFQNATTWGHDDKNYINITAMDGGSVNPGTTDIFVVDMFSHSAECTPTLASPTCTVNCAPFERPHNANPSCLSRPRLGYPIRDAQAQWVTAVAVPMGGGYYMAHMQPEVKGKYDIDVALLKQGGLNAFYYDNVWLVDLPDIARVDSTVNFQWGDGVITTYGKDYISIRWSGKLKADFTETYYIFAKADDGVRVWIDKQLIIDKWSTCCTETFNTVDLTAGHYHDIIVEYQELKDTASIELRWASSSVPKQIIPSTALYYRNYACDTPYNGFTFDDGPPPLHPEHREDHTEVRIWASEYPNANNSYAFNFVKNETGNVTVYSTGLTHSTAGQPSEFRVQLYDIFNNSLEAGLSLPRQALTHDHLKFEFVPAPGTPDYTGAEDNTAFDATKHHWPVNEDGLWQFNYTGQKSGGYHINIYTKDQGSWDLLAQGSSYLNESCAATDVSSSFYYGAGSESGTAGETAFFYIQAQDQFDNNRTTFGDNIWVVFGGSSPEPLHADVEYVDKGLYRAVYTPKLSGAYQMNIYLNEVLMPNIPTTVNVAVGGIYEPYCQVSGTNLYEATAGLTVAPLQLEFFDFFNNSVAVSNSATYTVSIQLIGPVPYNTTYDASNFAQVSNANNEDYDLTYKPILTGSFSLHIRISGQDILNSPFSLTVVPGAISATTTTAYGELITGSRIGYVQNQTTIYVQAKDSEENLLEQDVSANITATLTCGADVRVGSTSYTGQHGLHQVVITPTKKGSSCQVKVYVRQTQIQHSPWACQILPAQAHDNTSIVEQITTGTAGVNVEFDITAKDIMGNLLDTDTPDTTFYVDVYGPNFDLATEPYHNPARVTNHLNGTFHVDWTPIETGTYKTYVHLLKKGVGLEGRYFTDMYQTQTSLYLTRIDSNINFDWGLSNPFADDTIYPTDYWSVMWFGQLNVPASETYRIYANMDANCGVRLWLNRSDDGIAVARNFQKFVEENTALIDEYDPNEGGTEVFGDVLLEKGVYYNILIYYRDYLRDASLKLYWESPSNPKQIIPQSAFSTLRNVTAPYDVTISNAASFHNKSTTHRTGDLNLTYAAIESGGIPTQSVKAGIEFDFQIQLRDEFGNLQTSGGEASSLTVYMWEIFNAVSVSATSITDNGNGTYAVVMEPTLIGDFFLYVKLDNQDIVGSPFEVNVIPGNAYANKSWAEGTGYHNATVNHEARFYIYVRDMEENMRTHIDTVTVVTSGPVSLPVSVEYVGGGIYNATYVPVTKGTYTFQVYVNNKPLETTSTVTVYPDIASPSNSAMTNAVNASGASTTITVQTTDSRGNNLDVGGHFFYAYGVKVYDGSVARGTVTDNTDGTYDIAFTLANTDGGVHMVNIMLAKGHNGIGDGVKAEYFTNPWLDGTPVMTRIDPYINFNWGTDLITPTAKDYVSIEWTGYIKSKYAEATTFEIISDSGVRLEIDDTLVINNWLDTANTFTGTFTFGTADLLYKFKLQWRDTDGTAECKLFWSSTSLTKTLVIQDDLFSEATHITASPLRMIRS